MEQYTPEEIAEMKKSAFLEALLNENKRVINSHNQGNNPNSYAPIGTIEEAANSLGRRNDRYNPEHDYSNGAVLRDGGTTLGDLLYNTVPSSASGKLADLIKGVSDYLGNPYEVSGAQWMEDGANAAHQGYNDGDYVKMAGGAGMVAAPIAGGYGKLASKLFSSVPRCSPHTQA